VKVILTAWIGAEAQGKDLAKVIPLIPANMLISTWAVSISSRLHPRGKSSERETQAAAGVNIRTLTLEDAEVSVELVALLLRELKWTRSN